MFMRVSIACASLFVLCAASLLSAQVDESTRIAIRRLLVDGWQNTMAARAVVDEVYTKSVRSSQNANLQFAYLLALAKQRRHDEARPIVREFVLQHPDHLDSRWADVWLTLADRDYSGALVKLTELCESLQHDQVDAGPPGQNLESLLESMGQAIGYLEGPVRSNVKDLELERALGRIAGSLSNDQLVALQRGRSVMASDFRDRQQEIRQTMVEQQQTDENARQVQRTALEQEQATINQQLALTAQNRQRLEEQHAQQQSALENQRLAAAADLDLLNRQVRDRRTDLFLTAAQIAQLDAAIRREPDPVRRAVLIANLNELIRLQNWQHADVRVAEANLSGAQSVHTQTVQRQVSGQLGFANDQARLQRAAKTLEKRQKKVQRQSLKLVEPVSGSAKVRALKNRSTSLTTYVSSRLEDMRQKLLAEL